jgi:hypothetical protein
MRNVPEFVSSVIEIGRKQIKSGNLILKTDFDCFNGWGWGFGNVERHFAKK